MRNQISDLHTADSELSDRIDNVLNYDRVENVKLVASYGNDIPSGSIIRFKAISASTEDSTEIVGFTIYGMYGTTSSAGYDSIGYMLFNSDDPFLEITTTRDYHHLQISKILIDNTYNGAIAYGTYDIIIIPNNDRLSLYKDYIAISDKLNNIYNIMPNKFITSISSCRMFLTKDGIKITFSSSDVRDIIFGNNSYYFPKRNNPDYANIVELNFEFPSGESTYALVFNSNTYAYSIKQFSLFNSSKLLKDDIIVCYAYKNSNKILSYYTAIEKNFYIDGVENIKPKPIYLYSGKSNTCGILKDWQVITGEKYKIRVYNIEGQLGKIVMYYYTDIEKTQYVQINSRTSYYDYIEYNIEVTEKMKWLRLYTNTSANLEWNVTKIENDFNPDDAGLSLAKSIINDNLRYLSFGNSTCNIFKKVVCCGDSYTSGHISGVPDIATMSTNEDYAWPHYMELLTGNTWINCGHSGASSITWLTWDRGLPKAQTVGKTQAYVLGLQLNDVSASDRAVDLGTIEDIGADTDTTRTYYAGISRIIRELNTISPKAKIFVNTCPRTGGKYDTYNQALRDIVNEYKNTYPVHLIDLVPYKKYYDQISGDNVGGHYTAIGYERFAEIYKYVLSEYINTHITDFQDVHTIEYD